MSLLRFILRPYVNNSDLQNLDALEFCFQEFGNSIKSLSQGRLKHFEFCANFAKLKRRLRSFRLKRFEVYVNFARNSTLMSVKFVVAKLSSQTLRKSSSFRTLRRLHEQLAKLSTLIKLHGVQFIHGFTTTLVMHQARLMLPLRLQSFNGVNRV